MNKEEKKNFKKAGTGNRWAGLLLVNYRKIDEWDNGPCITELVDQTGKVKAIVRWSSRAYAAEKITEAENMFRKIIRDDGYLEPQQVIKILKNYGV